MKLEIADLKPEQWQESSIEKLLFQQLFETDAELSDNELDSLSEKLKLEEERLQQALVSRWDQVRQRTSQTAPKIIKDCQTYLKDVEKALDYTSKVEELDKKLHGLVNELEQTKADIAIYEKRVFIEEKISQYRDFVKDLQEFRHVHVLQGTRQFKQYTEQLAVLKSIQSQISEPSLKLYINESILWMGFEYEKAVENLELLVEKVLETFISVKHDRETDQARIILLNNRNLIVDTADVLETLKLWSIFGNTINRSLNENILNQLFSGKQNLVLAGDSEFLLVKVNDAPEFKDIAYIDGWLELYWKLMETLLSVFNAEKMRSCIQRFMIHERLDEMFKLFEDAMPSEAKAVEEYKQWINDKLGNIKYADLKPILVKLLESTSGSFLASLRESYLSEIKNLLDIDPKIKINDAIMPEKSIDQSKLGATWIELFKSIKLYDDENPRIAAYSSPTSFPTCRITTACKPIVALFSNIIKELKAISGLSAADIIKFLSECLGCYRVVSRKIFDSSALDKMPQQGILFHNDTHYIAFSLIEILSELDLNGQEVKSVVAELNIMYRHADGIYRKILDAQLGEVKRIVNEMKPLFANTLSADSREEIERLFKQFKHQLALLAKVFKAVPPWYMYLSTIISIAEELQSSIADAILDLDDLEERECEYLCQIIGISATVSSETTEQPFILRIENLVSKEIEGMCMIKQLDKSAILGPFMPRQTKKLEAVMALLNDPMSETMNKFRRGYFNDAQLQIPRDLVRMLRKVFSDTDRRRAAIDELQTTKKKGSILAETSSNQGNYAQIAQVILEKVQSEPGTKKTLIYDQLLIHFMIDEQELIYLCMAEESFGRRVPFAYLQDIKTEFEGVYGKLAPDMFTPAYAMNEFSKTLNDKMEYYNSNPQSDKIRYVQGEIDQVKDVMIENIEKVLERGERIDILVDKTDNLNMAALQFKKRSTALKREMWWKNAKITVILGLVVVVMLYLLVSAGCGFPAWSKCF